MITAHGTFEMARRALDNPLKRFHLPSMGLCLQLPLLVFKAIGDIQDFVHGYVMPYCFALYGAWRMKAYLRFRFRIIKTVSHQACF
jgi:hypothetical protein